ncbi:MAG: hypothetical protein HY868_14260 [Chloroflexi bacterium]|nr:hypothetical protein [Chloroflexota bacterium]
MRFDRNHILTFLARLFFLWIIYQYALGGWENARIIFDYIGLSAWLALFTVIALVLYQSDWRADVPLFVAAYALGYWGEWWGTTRGVWTYSNGQTPPDYLPPLWAIGLLTVTHLRALIMGRGLTQTNADKNNLSAFVRVNPRPMFMLASFIALPVLTFAISAPKLTAVDWSGRLDAMLAAGILVGSALIAYRFNLDEAFELYLCGMLLGGTYEWLGTTMREWTYITGEAPPLWIIPLWGLACIAMLKLSRLISVLARQAHSALMFIIDEFYTWNKIKKTKP